MKHSNICGLLRSGGFTALSVKTAVLYLLGTTRYVQRFPFNESIVRATTNLP